jgi:hypothetical protein
MGGVTFNSRSQLLHTFSATLQTGATVPVIAANNANIIAGQRVGLYALIITVSAAETIQIQDTASNALSAPIQLAANGSVVLDLRDNGDPWWQSTPANPGIQIAQGTGATSIGFDVWWLPTV